MRILVVQESNWIEKGPHQSHHLMERLSSRGHEIRVIDFDILWREKEHDSILTAREEFSRVRKATNDGNVKVIRPPTLNLPFLEYVSLYYFHRKEIAMQIDEFQPDIIVGFGILNAFISIRTAARTRIPFVYYVIDELHRLVPHACILPFARAVERYNMASAKHVFTINEGLMEYAVTMKATLDRTSVLGAGVDLEKFAADSSMRTRTRAKYGFSDDDIVLFFMGWLYEFTGLEEVVRAFANPEWQDKRLRLLIVGTGPLWDRLQAMRESLRLSDTISVTEWIPYDQVPSHVAAADICILPAQRNEIMENIVPIKMYEYMAGGKPVIATRLAGLVKEFSDGNGVVYIDRPEEALPMAVDIWTSGQYERMSVSAADFVRRRSWDMITNDFEAALKRLI